MSAKCESCGKPAQFFDEEDHVGTCASCTVPFVVRERDEALAEVARLRRLIDAPQAVSIGAFEVVGDGEDWGVVPTDDKAAIHRGLTKEQAWDLAIDLGRRR